MGIFDKFIINRAKKIKNKMETQRQAEVAADLEKRKQDKDIREEARRIIHQELNKKVG